MSAQVPGRLLVAAALIVALSNVAAADGAQSSADEARPLALTEALELAVGDAPQLSAQRLAVGAAEALIVPASQLPDPKLSLGLENFPVDGPDRFSVGRDFMTMRKIGLMQDFPREEKRRLRGERAAAEADKERAMLSALALTVRREVALAWLEAHFAQAEVATLTELKGETELLNAVAKAQLASGKSGATDPIAAQGARIALQDRIAESERNVKRARAALARWVGASHADRSLAAAPDLAELSRPPAELLASIEHHPELASYRPLEAVAEAEVALARAARKPDWSLEASYAQRGSSFSNMVNVAVRIDLPLWADKRQDPAILAKQQQLEQIRALRESARRMHEAEIRAQIADWETARGRATRIEKEMLPLARSRTETTLAAWRGGRGDINSVLAARNNEIETRLALVRQQAELARAWANLNFLIDTPAHAGKEKP